MFAEHQPVIAHYAKQSPDHTLRVVQFVQMTIQQHFYRMPTLLAQLDVLGHVPAIGGRRNQALQYYAREKQAIYDAIWCESSLADKLRFLVGLPGLGLVKAGFVLQLCLGEIGCIDTHNMKLYGFKPSQFSISAKTSIAVADRKIRLYLAVCKDLDCARLWDVWCEFVAAKYPNIFDDAMHVSRLHVDCILR